MNVKLKQEYYGENKGSKTEKNEAIKCDVGKERDENDKKKKEKRNKKQ